ncbi:MAG: hypothetical protein KKE42_12540 [Alphaproteobacteria bacterium]|jgi:hypothetical protein|uniref:hypothetical protein n=1 Tax=Brevundimonas sp. TaxID=1871086 RepID=UPI0018358D29|nr:hypothetical protein [Brevundimonas sp.]MBU3969687.1 hypothetical protein [Alphaproteobacteria bacterium]MBA3050918.1 hypothetical protein [Brevundimonas sp.]MBU3974611.1 hypothetical protein [Alphaproteobacteria bacterium]MBU4039154.1 hypothetical protein [Alphaproteobacteria bacterium]MBU4135085.1 hypothetical protein [Alphaproteobacteria bacterium]
MFWRLAGDVRARIDRDFRDPADRKAVRARLRSLWDMNLTVGPQQLARSILIVAGGDRSELEQLFESGFRGDPRDVIMVAMAISEGQAAYGTKPFRNP